MTDAGGRSRRRTLLNRFFHHEGKWYVEAREGRQGPFFRREDAVAYLERHKRRYRRRRADEDQADPAA